MVVKESAVDPDIMLLIENIRNGSLDHVFSDKRLNEYARVKNCLSEKDGILMYKSKIVIPKKLRSDVLEILHSAHQGCSSMEARSSLTIWWPGLKDDIAKKRAKCITCVQIAPSQPALPPVDPPQPDYPMQLI